MLQHSLPNSTQLPVLNLFPITGGMKLTTPSRTIFFSKTLYLKNFSLPIDNLFGREKNLAEDANSFSTILTEFFQQTDNNKIVLSYQPVQLPLSNIPTQKTHCSMDLLKIPFNFIPKNLNGTWKEIILDPEKPPVFISAQAAPQLIALLCKHQRKSQLT